MITTGDKTPSFGLAADGKPANVPNGHMHVEMDTSKVYFYDEENDTWLEDESGGGGGGGGESGGPQVLTLDFDTIMSGYFIDGQDTVSVADVAAALAANPAAYVFVSAAMPTPAFGYSDGQYGITITQYNAYYNQGTQWEIPVASPEASVVTPFSVGGGA